MTKLNNNYGRRSERGIALFIAIFTLLLITAIAAGMLMLTNTDTNISGNFRDEQTAFFAAKAGLEEVRDRMRVNAVNGATPPVSVSVNYTNPLAVPPSVSLLPGAATPNSAPPYPGQVGGVVYITNPLNGESDTPWITTGSAYPDDEICVEATHLGTGNGCVGNPPRPQGGSSPANWYVTASANSVYASNPVQPWKWVRINVKTNQTSSGTTTVSTVDSNVADTSQIVCWNGNTQLTVASGSCASAGALLVPAQNYTPVYTLTALAVTPSGSRRMVQMDVATDIIPNIPGAMVMDGDLPSFSPGTSNAFFANGNDQGSSVNSLSPHNGTVCPPPGNEPAVGAYDNTSMATIVSSFGTGGSSRIGNYSGTPGPVWNVGTPLGAGGMNTVQGLTALVNQVTAAASPANTYTNAGALTNPGTVINPVINVVTGDLNVSNLIGSGILLVEGNATFTGRPNYDGVILIIGKGNISISGGGNGVIDGAMLVANLYDSGGHLIPSGAPGLPTIAFGNSSGGGNMTIQYDSCWVAAMNQGSPYKSLGVREMAY